MASSDEDQPWGDRWPDELTEIVSSLRAEGWVIAQLDKCPGEHTVVMQLVGFADPPGWLKVQLGPGTPTVAPTVFGPGGLAEHQHPTGKNLCLPANARNPVSAVQAAIRLYQDPPGRRHGPQNPGQATFLGHTKTPCCCPSTYPPARGGHSRPGSH